MQQIMRDYRLSLSMKSIFLLALFYSCLVGFTQSTYHLRFDNPDGSPSQNSMDITQAINGDVYATSKVAPLGKGDIRLIRIDPYGIVQLDTIYKFTPSEEFTPKVIAAHDGGVVVASTSYSYPIDDQDGIQDILIWKIDPDGLIQWQQVLAARSFHSMIPTKDGNYVILGNHYENSLDLLVYKISPNGEIIWKEIIGETWQGGAKVWEFPSDVAEIDGDIYIGAGETTPSESGFHGIMYQLDSLGNTNWKLRIPKESDGDKLQIIEPFELNGVYYFRIRFNKDIYRFSNEVGDYLNISDSVDLNIEDLAQPSCGDMNNFVSISGEEGNYTLGKYDQLNGAYYEKTLIEVDGEFEKIISSIDGGYIILSFDNQDMEILKTDCLGNSSFWSEECASRVSNDLEVICYPNPANQQLNIEAVFDFDEIIIHGIDGSSISIENICSCNTQTIDISNLASGVYILEITGEREAISKFVKY